MNFRDSGYALTYLGLAGIVFVTILGLEYAPGLKPCTGGGCWGLRMPTEFSIFTSHLLGVHSYLLVSYFMVH